MINAPYILEVSNVKDLFVQMVAKCNLPFHYVADQLSKLVPKLFPDSAVARELVMGTLRP